ncbi:MAG TPA: pentapeptide repeat-containing protein, partial [Caulobacteraceae bacterium]|nr:pentapeptide repeat-containing protein [Caulobacteraceae bacterium]
MSALSMFSRLTVALGLASLMMAAAAGQAYAAAGDKDVPRLVSFGGSCPNCELSGRKLTGAR